MLSGERVPAGEHAVQQRDDVRGEEPFRQTREADDVGEHYGHVLSGVGDDSVVSLEPGGHGLRQHVE